MESSQFVKLTECETALPRLLLAVHAAFISVMLIPKSMF